MLDRLAGVLDKVLNKITKSSYPRTKALSDVFKTSVECKKLLITKKMCKIDPKDLPREVRELTKAVKKL